MQAPAGHASTSHTPTAWWMGGATHLASLLGYVVPLGGLIGPAVVWFAGRDEHPFVDDQGREAINFRLTLWLCALVLIPLAFLIVGIPLLWILAILDPILSILATLVAVQGRRWRYPFAIRFLERVARPSVTADVGVMPDEDTRPGAPTGPYPWS